MLNFLFLKHDVPSKGYRAGDMKPVWAGIIFVVIIILGGMNEYYTCTTYGICE